MTLDNMFTYPLINWKYNYTNNSMNSTDMDTYMEEHKLKFKINT